MESCGKTTARLVSVGEEERNTRLWSVFLSVCTHTHACVCICPDALNDSSLNESRNDPSVSCEGLSDERGPTGRWGTTLEHVPTGC